MLSAGSLFTGIGGLDLAAVAAGFDIRFQVEIDDFCRKVLKKHAGQYWPNSVIHMDVTKVGSANLPKIDLLFGGFPCQPHSKAGKRMGADDSRNLWPDFARIISEIRPRAILLENVPGILEPRRVKGVKGGWLPAYAFTVIGDLAKLGYVGRAGVVPASAVGTTHIRERWWCVAYADSIRHTGQGQDESSSDKERHDTAQEQSRNTEQCQDIPSSQVLVNANGEQLQECIPASCSTETERLNRRHDTGIRSERGLSESKLGGDANGLSRRMDGHLWPAGQGIYQHEWEPSRLTSSLVPNHRKRLAALGNAVVPQVALPMMQEIYRNLQEQA